MSKTKIEKLEEEVKKLNEQIRRLNEELYYQRSRKPSPADSNRCYGRMSAKPSACGCGDCE